MSEEYTEADLQSARKKLAGPITGNRPDLTLAEYKAITNWLAAPCPANESMKPGGLRYYDVPPDFTLKIFGKTIFEGWT